MKINIFHCCQLHFRKAGMRKIIIIFALAALKFGGIAQVKPFDEQTNHEAKYFFRH
jgi:hypothetical protein